MTLKIIATLGPSSSNNYIIENMILNNVSGFRINFSHGSQSEWNLYIKTVRKFEEKHGKYIALIGDLTGRSIRIGLLSNEIEVKRNQQIKFKFENKSNGTFIPIPKRQFFKSIDIGDLILMDDGKISLKVEKASGLEAILRVISPGIIRSRKAVTIRGKEVDLPAISDYDINCIKYAIKNDFDYIALSHVRNKNDLKILREIIESKDGSEIGLIAKIETISSIKNLDEIITNSDVILVARGDLGMQFPLEEVPWLQKSIINSCHKHGKPVIIATQVLASMINSPSPTRAEITDIVTAISEGADAIMLTGETAIGKYPIEAVKWLKRTIESYKNKITYPKQTPNTNNIKMKFAYSVVILAESLNSKLAVYTKKGRTAIRISKFKPKVKFYASSNNIKTLRKLSIIWGIEPLKVSSNNYIEGVEETYRKLIELNKLKNNETIILTYGFIEEDEHTIKIRKAKLK